MLELLFAFSEDTAREKEREMRERKRKRKMNERVEQRNRSLFSYSCLMV